MRESLSKRLGEVPRNFASVSDIGCIPRICHSKECIVHCFSVLVTEQSFSACSNDIHSTELEFVSSAPRSSAVNNSDPCPGQTIDCWFILYPFLLPKNK